MAEDEQPRVQPSFGDVLRNLRGAGNPLAAVRGMVGNTRLKVQRRDNCCGNYGDPGCWVSKERAIQEGWLKPDEPHDHDDGHDHGHDHSEHDH